MVFDHPKQSQIDQYVHVKIQKDIADERLSCLQTELKVVEEKMKKIKARSAKYHKELMELRVSSKQKDHHIKNLWKMILSLGCNHEKNGLTSKDKSKLKQEFVKWFPSENTQNQKKIADIIDKLEDIKATLDEKLTSSEDLSKTDKIKSTDEANESSLSSSISDKVTSSDDSAEKTSPSPLDETLAKLARESKKKLSSYPCSPDSLSQVNNENTKQRLSDFTFLSKTSPTEEQLHVACSIKNLVKADKVPSEVNSYDELDHEIFLENSAMLDDNVKDLSGDHKVISEEKNGRDEQPFSSKELVSGQNVLQRKSRPNEVLSIEDGFTNKPCLNNSYSHDYKSESIEQDLSKLIQANDPSKLIQKRPCKTTCSDGQMSVKTLKKNNKPVTNIVVTCVKESFLSDNHQSLLNTIEKAKKLFTIVEFPLSPIPGIPSNEPDTEGVINPNEQVDENLCPEIEAQSSPKLSFKQSEEQKNFLKEQPSFAAPVRVRGRTRLSINKLEQNTITQSKEKDNMPLIDVEFSLTKALLEDETIVKESTSYSTPHNCKRVRIQHTQNNNNLKTSNINHFNVTVGETDSESINEFHRSPENNNEKPTSMETTNEEKHSDATLENEAQKSNKEVPVQNLVKSFLNEESVPNNSTSVHNEDKVPTCIEDIISSISNGTHLTKSNVDVVKNNLDQKNLCSILKSVDKIIKKKTNMARSKIDEDVLVNNYNLAIIPNTLSQHSLVSNKSKLGPKSFCAQKESSSQKRKNEDMAHTFVTKKKKKIHKVQEFNKSNTSTTSTSKTLVPIKNAKGVCEFPGSGKKESLAFKNNEENSSNCHSTPKAKILTKKAKGKHLYAKEKAKKLKLERTSKNNFECTDNPIEKLFETFKDNLCEDYLKNIVHSLVKLLLNQSSFPNKATLLFHVFNYLRHTKCTPLTTFALSEDQTVLLPFVEKCIVVALFRIELKKITYLEGLLETAVTTSYNLILTKDFQMCGLASLCRVFTEICKRLKDSLKPVLLSAELLKTKRAFSSYLIASIASVWKELFYNNNTELVEQKLLHSSILYGACKKRPKGLFECNWNSSMNIFSKNFNAPPVNDAKTAIHVLKEYIQAKCQNGSWKSDYMRASLTILAVHEDWSWVKENVLDRYILPNLDKFGKTTLNEAAFYLYCKLYVDIYCIKPQPGEYSFDNDLSNIYSSPEVWQGEFVKDCVALSLIRLNYLKNRSLPFDLNTWFKTNHQNPKVLEDLDIFNRKLMLTSRKELLVEEIL
ncbi:hypothetical protein JTE90_014732 [Oedothorax gibbosus]|uniref:Uncharacterized protein n=1 Tax=Oedothorax gibbosus TaxID=931172 RepID=A0AAV6USW1_9ARAC|nr:hypothetical protein JTE90_014732 [Oedothorax gibbosus]